MCGSCNYRGAKRDQERQEAVTPRYQIITTLTVVMHRFVNVCVVVSRLLSGLFAPRRPPALLMHSRTSDEYKAVK